MNPGDPRVLLQQAQRDLTDTVKKLGVAQAQLDAINTLVRPKRELLVELQEILTFAVRARDTEKRFTELIAHLRGIVDPEARAIGNSMDVLFRSVPVPEAVARR